MRSRARCSGDRRAAAPGTGLRATRRRGETGRAAASSCGRRRRAPTSSPGAASRARLRGSSPPRAWRAAARGRAARRPGRGTGSSRGRWRRGRSSRAAARGVYAIHSISGEVDVAYSVGRRNGTSAPYQRATSAISSESVETSDALEHARLLRRRDRVGEQRVAGERTDVLVRRRARSRSARR